MYRFIAVCSLILGIIMPHSVLAQSAPATVYMDVDSALLREMNVAFIARDRLSRAGSVDQMFIIGSTPVAGQPTADTVGYKSVNNKEVYNGSSIYDFSLEYTASNQTYRYGLTNGSVSGDVVFRNSGPNSTLTYNASKFDYNIIHIYGVSTTIGSSMSVSDLVFVPGVGLATPGLLEAAGTASALGDRYYDQWLAAPTGVNLANYDWAMKARVELTTTTNSPSSGEGIKFEVSTKKGIFDQPVVPVPEPASAMLSIVSVISVMMRRKRN